MNAPEAVLFDFDGVLADTSNVHIATWERCFAAMGLDVGPEVCARAAEEDDRLFLASVLAERGLTQIDMDGWIRRKQDLARSLLRDAPSLCHGVPRVISTLRGRTRLAVVSMSWRENIEAVLDGCGLRDAFELIVAKEDVRAVKPDPEAYHLALQRLGLESEKAVAVEDSLTGLSSARDAGIRVVVVGHGKPRADWGRDWPYLANFRDLEQVLNTLGFPTA